MNNGVKVERLLVGMLTLFFLISLIIVALKEVKEKEGRAPEPFISQEAMDCYECHAERSISQVAIAEWKRSAHADKGIGCNECHIPSKDAGEDILKEKTICEDKRVRKKVSYNNCKRCHEDQVKQFLESIHYYAEKNLRTAIKFYNVKVNEKECMTCHITGREDRACSSCHSQHLYSGRYARSPESCKSCHDGVYPYYTSSAHGRVFFSEEWDLSYKLEDWKKGIDYPLSNIPLSPTCALCHMQGGNHKIGVNDGVSFANTILFILSEELKLPLKMTRKKSLLAISDRKRQLRKDCAKCHPLKWSEERINDIYKEVEGVSKIVTSLLKKERVPYNPHLIPSEKRYYEPYYTVEKWSLYIKRTLHFGKGDTY